MRFVPRYNARSIIEDRALAFKKGWPKASVATKKRLMRRLVDGLIYTRDGLQVFYVTAKDAPTVLTASKTKMASEIDSGATSDSLHFLSANGREPFRLFSDNGSPVVLNGGDGAKQPKLLKSLSQKFRLLRFTTRG